MAAEVEIYKTETDKEQECAAHKGPIAAGSKYAAFSCGVIRHAKGKHASRWVRICADCLAAMFTAVMFDVTKIEVRDMTREEELHVDLGEGDEDAVG